MAELDLDRIERQIEASPGRDWDWAKMHGRTLVAEVRRLRDALHDAELGLAIGGGIERGARAALHAVQAENARLRAVVAAARQVDVDGMDPCANDLLDLHDALAALDAPDA